MLAAAGARLARPALASAVAHWRADWDAERLEAAAAAGKGTAGQLRVATKERDALKQEVEELHEDKIRQVASTKAALEKALEQLRTELTGSAEEQAAMQLERDKEKRVEELCAKAAKRIGNQGLIKGWTGWHDMWEEQARQKRMLAAAGARLARPALAAAMVHWRADWDAELLAEARLKGKNAAGAAGQQVKEARAEVQELQAELKRQVAAAKVNEEKALARLRTELTGSAEEQAAMQLEKEQRVEQLAHKAIKRTMNQGIMKGFSAWHDMWEVATRQKRMIAAAGARLARPALAASVSHWRNDWEVARRKELAEEVERRTQAMAGGAAGRAMQEMKADMEAELKYVKQAAA